MSATRRETLRRGALAGATLAAAGLAPALIRPELAAAEETAEDLRDFLEPAIELEQASVLAYATALDAAPAGELRTMLELLRDQDQAHANALRNALDLLGFDLPEPPASPADADELEGLPDLSKPDDYLRFLAELERDLIAHYVDTAPDLESEDLARTSAEVVGSHAQHLVILREALGDSPAAALAAVGAGKGRGTADGG